RDRRPGRARRRRRHGGVADREADHRGLLHEDQGPAGDPPGRATGAGTGQGGHAMRGTGLLLPRATVGVSRWRRVRAAGDWPLIVVIVALCTLGLLNLYSATRGVRHHAKFDTQVQWMVVGAIGFAVATIVDYRAMVRLAWAGLGVAISLLLVARV